MTKSIDKIVARLRYNPACSDGDNGATAIVSDDDLNQVLDAFDKLRHKHNILKENNKKLQIQYNIQQDTLNAFYELSSPS